MTGRRVVKVLDLIDDAALIAEYGQWHSPGAVWPEVTTHLVATGVLDMEIWTAGTRLVMILVVSDDFPRPVKEPARVTEWEARMSTYQQRLPGNLAEGEKWVSLTRIFTLGELGSLAT
jgi:L-rhamnose mutarotase